MYELSVSNEKLEVIPKIEIPQLPRDMYPDNFLEAILLVARVSCTEH